MVCLGLKSLVMLQVMEIRDAIREDRCCQVGTALDLSGKASCDGAHSSCWQ